jgi:hypothetical protein
MKYHLMVDKPAIPVNKLAREESGLLQQGQKNPVAIPKV